MLKVWEIYLMLSNLTQLMNADRTALYYGPSDPNARFWGTIATSRRNRSVNRVSKKLQKSECEKSKC